MLYRPFGLRLETESSGGVGAWPHAQRLLVAGPTYKEICHSCSHSLLKLVTLLRTAYADSLAKGMVIEPRSLGSLCSLESQVLYLLSRIIRPKGPTFCPVDRSTLSPR
jgi:hypothetical protein